MTCSTIAPAIVGSQAGTHDPFPQYWPYDKLTHPDNVRQYDDIAATACTFAAAEPGPATSNSVERKGHDDRHPDRMTAGERFALGSVAFGCLVLGLKSLAWWLTGSAALYSDALESIVNVVASGVAFAALRFAARPADANHPYGHDKAEFFSAVIEGVLIVIAAFSIFDEAWHAWLAPRAFNAPGQGLILNAIATAINGTWAWVLIRASRRLRSPTLRADGRHLISDVVNSCGVGVGFALTILTGYQKLDPLVAAAAGVYVLWSGASLIGGSVGGLMDMAPDTAILRRISDLIAKNGTGSIEAHDVRAREAGRMTFLEFHLVVPGAMSVSESHAICDRIEAALTSDMPHLAVTIHVEPEEKAKLHRGKARPVIPVV
jgi:cation diffusion facilitator family transporter